MERHFLKVSRLAALLADAFDLATNEGLGGVVQHEQLATVLLARHFQSLHVEQRALAVRSSLGWGGWLSSPRSSMPVQQIVFGLPACPCGLAPRLVLTTAAGQP